MNKIDFKSLSLFDMLRHLWGHLSRRRQGQLTFAVILMILSGFAEVISLGAVLPLIGALISPDRLYENKVVLKMTQVIGIQNTQQLVAIISITFVFASLVSGGVRLVVLWVCTRLSFSTAVDLSISMYRRTLCQPYRVHLARNSAEVISGITAKTSNVAIGVLMPMLGLISSAVMLLAVVLTLMAIDPLVATISVVGFGSCYAAITLITRNRVEQNSQKIAVQQTRLFRAIEEGLGGIRDVILDGTQSLYCAIYYEADKSLRMAQSSNTFISASPRYAMEALGMIVMTAIAYSLSNREGGLAGALPVLGVMALAAQRLVPALQHAYAAWINIAGNKASLADALDFLNQPLPQQSTLIKNNGKIVFEKCIRLENVSFKYTAEGLDIFENLNLMIPKGARVAFVGSTGSGKSTLTDIIMGLLQPTSGRMLIDDVPIDGSNVFDWQKNIAHVPQSIYLADGTIAENIAFGESFEKINMERVRLAAQNAQIAEYIETSAVDGYQTQVGERGVRLSGGQRQRIGVARALYKQANVLILDEATSALDTATERALMDSIEKMGREITVIMIAHRLTTVQDCDSLFEFKAGKLIAQESSYNQLLRRSETFRQMVGLGLTRGDG